MPHPLPIWPWYANSLGRQRKLDAENQSVRKPTRKMPGALEPAYELRSRPVEPKKFGCSISERARSSSSDIALGGV